MASGISRPAAKHLLVLHESGEGAHAFIDALNRRYCTAMGKEIDSAGIPYKVGGRISAPSLDREQAVQEHDYQVLRALFDTPFESLSQNVLERARAPIDLYGDIDRTQLNKQLAAIADLGQGASTHHERCECVSRGALVRLEKTHLASLCSLGLFRRSELASIRPVILVRTDLMRYTLSAYSRFSSKMANHPQFSAANRSAGRIVYNLAKLFFAAKTRLKNWSKIAENIAALQACNVTVTLSIYEEFEDLMDVGQSLFKYLAPCVTSNLMRSWAKATVRKVHQHAISDFALNYEEIHHFFAASDFPTFGEVLQRKKGVRMEALVWL